MAALPDSSSVKANYLLIFCLLVWPRRWIEGRKKCSNIYFNTKFALVALWILFCSYFYSYFLFMYKSCRSQSNVGPFFSYWSNFPPTDLSFQVWELPRGIRRVNRHSVWIPACGEANSLHYSAQLATMFLPSSGKSPERLLNPLLCIQRLELCCTCQSGQTELVVPHLYSANIWYSDWKYSEFSNFHRSVGSRRLAIPPTCESSDACTAFAPAVAQSASSAPLNRPVSFMILLLTSAISDQPLTPRLMLLQLSRIQLWKYSRREAGFRTKGRVLFCRWFPAFMLNTNWQDS